MKMRCALPLLLGVWSLHAAALPYEDRSKRDAVADSAWAQRAADDRAWGRDGADTSFSHQSAGTAAPLALEQPNSPIPEPSTWALVGTGLGWVALLGWRRRKKD